MSMVISLLNLKGGVGKTVSSINIAYALADAGKKVLIVDTDSQGNVATAMGIAADTISNTIVDLLSEEIDGSVDLARITECIMAAGKVDILPSNARLAGLDCKLMNAFNREMVLKAIVDKLRGIYDYIIIDCPPSLGLIVRNVLTASDYVLIPVEAHYLSFESLQVTLSTIDMVRLKLNPNLKIAGIFLTMYQSRTNLSKGIKEKLHESYGEEIRVFEETVPYSIKAAEQTLYGKSMIELNPNHPVSAAYQSIAKGLMEYEE